MTASPEEGRLHRRPGLPRPWSNACRDRSVQLETLATDRKSSPLFYGRLGAAWLLFQNWRLPALPASRVLRQRAASERVAHEFVEQRHPAGLDWVERWI